MSTSDNNRLPGINSSFSEILKILDSHMATYYCDNYHYDIRRVSETEIDISINVGTELDPAVLTLHKRIDQSISIIIRKNDPGKPLLLAKKLREELYRACGIGSPVETNDVYEHLSQNQYDAIISYLCVQLKKIDCFRETFHFQCRFEDLDGSRLTVHYYPSSRKFMAQTGLQKLSSLCAEALKNAAGIRTKEEEFAEHEKQVLDYFETESLEDEIKRNIGDSLIEYLIINNVELLETIKSAFKLKQEKRTMKTSDYSHMVQNICRCYEGLMKTLFDQMGFPKTRIDRNGYQVEMFVSSYFHRNKQKDTYSLDYCYDSKKKRLTKKVRDQLGSNFKPYVKYRNQASHGGERGKHIVIQSYAEALTAFNEISKSINASFELLKDYL